MQPKLILIGRCGNDPKSGQTKSGMIYSRVSLACSYKYKDEEKTTWVNCTFFGKSSEIIARYGFKGQNLYVEGSPSADLFTDRDNETRASLNCIVQNFQMLSFKDDNERKEKQSTAPSKKFQQDLELEQPSFTEEDIPF